MWLKDRIGPPDRSNLVSEELVKSIVVDMPMYSCIYGLEGTKSRVQRSENWHNSNRKCPYMIFQFVINIEIDIEMKSI